MKKNANMHGFDMYLDLVFNGFELYIVTLVQTESGSSLKVETWRLSSCGICRALIGQNGDKLRSNWLDFTASRRERLARQQIAKHSSVSTDLCNPLKNTRQNCF